MYQPSAQGIASLGRGQDSMLVHMTPGEVQGLQTLAMRHGGSLTINPQTGLPEAGFLSSLLPMLAGAALTAVSGGTLSPMMAAMMVGGGAGIMTGSLKKGLMAGLGAYGGANLGGSLSAMGAEQANALATADLSAAGQGAITTGNQAADAAMKFAEQNKQAAIADAITKGRGADFSIDPFATEQSVNYMGDSAYRADLLKNPMDNRLVYDAVRPLDFQTNPYTQQGVGYMQSQGLSPQGIAQSAKEAAADAYKFPGYRPETQAALARGPAENMFAGVKQLGSTAGIKNLGGRVGLAGVGALATPLISGMMEQPKANLPGQNPVSFYRTKYNQAKYNPATGRYDIPGYYDPGSYGPTAYVKTGGRIGGEKPKYDRAIYSNSGGVNSNAAGEGPYSNAAEEPKLAGVKELFDTMDTKTLKRFERAAKTAESRAAAIKEIHARGSVVDPYVDDVTTAAQGGLTSSDYAAGGKLLRGAGDGMSDSIPAVIRGPKPQRAALADGEFVIPADVVSHLGNGSTDAGAKRLYAMMDKVRHARTGNEKQGKQIKAERFMPA